MVLVATIACKNKSENISEKISHTAEAVKYPSDIIPFMDEWKILLGDGTHHDSLVNFAKEEFFYVENDGQTDWVVYKTPNAGITSKNSNNTRTELGQKKNWPGCVLLEG